MRQPWNSVKAAILIVGCLVAILATAYYPGHLSSDAVEQLLQARTNCYNDWHPPLVTYAWGLLDRILPGTGAILLVNMACLSTGLLLALTCFFSPIAAAGVTSLILVSPPILGVAGMIIQDATMMGLLALAIGTALTAECTQVPGRAKAALLAAALVYLILAQACRHNAYPLTAIIGYAVLRIGLHTFGHPSPAGRPALRELALLVTAFALFALAALSVPLINRYLLNSQKTFPQQHIMIYDLAGISLKTGTLLLDADIYPPHDLAALEEDFTGESAVALPIHVHDIEEPERVRSLQAQWIEAIAAHPWQYVAVRFRLFYQLLSLPGYRVVTPFFQSLENGTLNLRIVNLEMNAALIEYLEAFENSLIDRAWIYLLGTGASIAVLRWRPPSAGGTTLQIIGVAALLYVAPYFLIAPSCEFRYIAPPVLFAMLLMAVTVRQATRPRLAAPPPKPSTVAIKRISG